MKYEYIGLGRLVNTDIALVCSCCDKLIKPNTHYLILASPLDACSVTRICTICHDLNNWSFTAYDKMLNIIRIYNDIFSDGMDFIYYIRAALDIPGPLKDADADPPRVP